MIFTIIFVPETKNKTMEEVENLFRAKKKRGAENEAYEREIEPPPKDAPAKYVTRL
jgi:hypothetical protein